MIAELARESESALREPGYLFVLNPAYCGSTPFAHFLASSGKALGAHVNAEGQWLPSVRDEMTPDRWNPEKAVAWDRIKKEWTREWQLRARTRPDARLMIEKSPPNLLRAREIERNFPDARFIVLMRNPYAWCWSFKTRENVRDGFDAVARTWLARARRQRANLAELKNVIAISYEELVADPVSVKSKVEAFCPEIGSLDVDVVFQVKDYPPARLADHNARQIAKLSGADRDAITRVLETDPEIVAAFGYEILRGAK